MANNLVENRINTIKVKGILQLIFGWWNAIFFGIGTIGGFANIKEASDVGMSLFCLALTAIFVWLIYLGQKNMKLIKNYRNYSARLTTDPRKSLDFLASSMGVSIDVVTKNITAMLNHGLFPNAFLDKQTNCLVFTTPQSPVQQAVISTPPRQVTYITVQCRGCGATNKVMVGSMAECEYCGSPIYIKG